MVPLKRFVDPVVLAQIFFLFDLSRQTLLHTAAMPSWPPPRQLMIMAANTPDPHKLQALYLPSRALTLGLWSTTQVWLCEAKGSRTFFFFFLLLTSHLVTGHWFTGCRRRGIRALPLRCRIWAQQILFRVR